MREVVLSGPTQPISKLQGTTIAPSGNLSAKVHTDNSPTPHVSPAATREDCEILRHGDVGAARALFFTFERKETQRRLYLFPHITPAAI